MRGLDREGNFAEIIAELEVNNTIFPFQFKGSDDGEVDMDKIDWVVMRVEPLTRDALRFAYELSVLKTHIDREVGNIGHDDNHDTSSILYRILEGEINHAGKLTELSQEWVNDFWNEHILPMSKDHAEEFQRLDGFRLSLYGCDSVLEDSYLNTLLTNAENQKEEENMESSL
ncbi:hypothetical protein OAT47_01195 [Gammaproteobacteria bacterium]|nr:hypothetical protein [Gammaproteobacteria bacterium]